jgi:hypothetical protein
MFSETAHSSWLMKYTDDSVSPTSFQQRCQRKIIIRLLYGKHHFRWIGEPWLAGSTFSGHYTWTSGPLRKTSPHAFLRQNNKTNWKLLFKLLSYKISACERFLVTPDKNACQSANVLQFLQFSTCFYKISHKHRKCNSYKSYVFCFSNCHIFGEKMTSETCR